MDGIGKPVSAAYMAAVDLALSLGHQQIANLPGAWEHRVDEHWTVAINGKEEAVEVEPDGCMRVKLEPYHLAVWWHGWLAGLLTPTAGALLGADEDSLIAALKAAAGAPDGHEPDHESIYDRSERLSARYTREDGSRR
ncbi:MAG TPA: hypothetical protein VGK43_06925 [Solirubrobacterales bacterium]